MNFVVHRVSKSAARYTDAGGREKCGYCRFFMAPRACGKVIGPVSPQGWCKYFSRQIVSQFGGSIVTGGPPPGMTFERNFLTGTLGAGAVFTRASPAQYFDNTGTMQAAAINAPRFDYDPSTLALKGVLLEDASTNSLRNSTAIGAVPGTPGTMPTNWAINAGTSGLSSQVVGTGTENGIAYLDFRIFGTAAVGAQFQVLSETTTGIPALTGQTWTFSWFWRIVGGTANGFNIFQTTIRECTAAGATVLDHATAAAFPTTATLRTQRYTQTSAFTGGGTVGATHTRWLLSFSSGSAVDVTIRFGLPQLEQLPYASSPIPTSTVAVTRAADALSYPVASIPGFDATKGALAFDYIIEGSKPGASAPAQFVGAAPATDYISVDEFTATGATGIAPTLALVTDAVGGASVASATFTQVPVPGGVVHHGAASWATGAALAAAHDGVANASAAGTATSLPTIANLTLAGPMHGLPPVSLWAQRVSYWLRQLSQSELVSRTT